MSVDTGSGSQNSTTISTPSLRNLQAELQILLDGVTQQLQGVGHVDGETVRVPAVDQNLFVYAGGVGEANGGSFDIANALNATLSTMGGTVHEELTWLQKVLRQMIDEIGTSTASFSSTDNLNGESATELIQEFQTTSKQIGSSPAA